MKKHWILAMGFALMVTVVGLVSCGPGNTVVPAEIQGINISNQQNGIWVTGQGKVTTVPDIATLRLGIEAQEENVAQAQGQAAEAMDRVMTALTDNGVAEKDIQAQYFNIHQVTRWDGAKEEEIVVGYRVNHMVRVKIRNVDKTGAIIDTVAEAGGDLTRIDSISFSVDDPSDYYEEVRQKAMADARTKAEQIAELADVNLGEPTYIYEGLQVPTPRYAPVPLIDFAEAGAAVETPISAGEMEIILSLQVAYAIR
ncbi:SIMPL domain-containing protein [Chloroflexota bacterium]